MLNYLRKLGLFLFPLLALYFVELFLLPMDFFAFRCWEALLIDDYRTIGVAGGFYPNHHLIRYEAGDRLGFRDPSPQKAEWITDEFGFRNRPCERPPTQYDFVLLGDSNIVGSGLDQAETLSEVLARKGGCTVYSYGGGLPQKKFFWSDPRFCSHSPKTIVVEARPGEFYKAQCLPWISIDSCELPRASMPMLPIWARVLISRTNKQNMLQFTKSRLRSALYRNSQEPAEKDLPSKERVEFMVSKVLAMQKEAHRRGSEFIFFLMPTPDRSLDAGIVELRKKGVKTIAYLPTPKYKHGLDLDWYYQPRDSHWSKEAVELTADEILKLTR
jgi:hypothetical protein